MPTSHKSSRTSPKTLNYSVTTPPTFITSHHTSLTSPSTHMTSHQTYVTGVTHLSQVCPVLWSRHLMHRPVLGSHSSVCPLQVQGRQVGKPQWPGRQRSHCRPYAPGTHTHWPVSWSQNELCEPWGSHTHAENTQNTNSLPQYIMSIYPQFILIHYQFILIYF